MTSVENQVAILNRQIKRIAATCQRINPVNAAGAAATLDRLIDRILTKCHPLARAERDPDSPGLRRRTPAIRKTLSGAAGAQSFLTRAATVFRCGGEVALKRFAEGERAAGRLE